MEQAARDARSASLPLLHPASPAALLGPAPEPMPGRPEGTDSLVSASASPGEGNWGAAGGPWDPPVAVLAGKMGTWGTGTASPGWPCGAWAEDPPGVPKSRFVSSLCHAGCAVVAVHGQRARARRGSSAGGTSPAAVPRTGWHQSKGKEEPRQPQRWQPLGAAPALWLSLAASPPLAAVPDSC